MEISYELGTYTLTFGGNEELPLGFWADLIRWRAGYKCQICGKEETESGRSILIAHHIRPLSCGGKTTLKNGICECTQCHGRHQILRPGAVPTKLYQSKLAVLRS